MGILSLANRWADAPARLVCYAGFVLFPALILVGLYEVVARYAFNAPTIWAFDITFMVHGALFMLTGAYGLQKNVHVRIDVLSSRLPMAVQHIANILSYVFLFVPAIWIVADAAFRRSYSAFVTDEVELVSAWAPIVWPFYTALAIGLFALWLQACIETVRHGAGVLAARRAATGDGE